MNSVCPNSIYTSDNYGTAANAFLNNTLLSNNMFTSVPVYSPTNRTVQVNVRGTNYTANLFSITAMVEARVPNRYLPPGSGYWRASQSGTLQSAGALNDIYANFRNTDIPGKNRKIIAPTTAPMGTPSTQGNLTGNVVDAIETVSYDFLYSLQYEFCYFSKMYQVLLRDYLKLQNLTMSETFTQAVRDEQIRLVVNNMNAVKLRLNDLIEIAVFVGNSQTGELTLLNQIVNQYVSGTKNNVDILNTNQKILSTKDKESGLRYRQLEYSEEKNAYANQLLAMYGFANLIALGLLFYIYKS